MRPRSLLHRILPACLVPIALTMMPVHGDRAAVELPVLPRVSTPPTPTSVPSRVLRSPAGARRARPIMPAHAGMVVAIDPETGELGLPTPEQRAEMTSTRAAITRTLPSGFLEIRSATGAVGIDPRGQLQEFAVVQMGPDGRPVFGCIRPAAASPSGADTLALTLEER